MRFRRHNGASHKPRSLDDAVLPLTNVVFLLLIFFMLAGHLSTPEPFAITPPQSVSQTRAGSQGMDVQISADGQLAFEGHTLTATALQAAVRKRLANNPDTRLRLHADGTTESARVVKIMRRLHAAGAHQLRLITISADAS